MDKVKVHPTKLHHNRLQLARIQLAVLAENLVRTGNLRQLRQYRSRLGGRFPAPGGSGIVLCACDDLYYRRFAMDFVLSAEATGQHQRVHLHLCAPSAQTFEHVERLQGRLEHAELSWTYEGTEFQRHRMDPPIYYTSVRYLVMHHLLAECRVPILCVDIDGVIRRPLDPAFEQIEAADLTIHFRLHRKAIWRRVLAAAIGVSPTPAALRFSERMAGSIEAVLRQRPVYHIDQTILFYSYRIRRMIDREIRWQNLPISWVDYDFSDDSLIWTAKSERKQNPRFRDAIAELEARYRTLYQDLPRPGVA